MFPIINHKRQMWLMIDYNRLSMATVDDTQEKFQSRSTAFLKAPKEVETRRKWRDTSAQLLYYYIFLIPISLADHIQYENTPFEIYWKFHHQKLKVFRQNSDIFQISAQNIDCGYSLVPPRWGGSKKYPQSMFLAEIRKIMYTPVNAWLTI